MRKRITVIFAAAVASLALLIPSADAAQYRYAHMCQVYPDGGPMTLKPGERCTFLPVATFGFGAAWQVIKPGGGAICAGVTRYPPYSSNVPLDGYGRPTSWDCVSPTNASSGGFVGGALTHNVSGPFNAVSGQATVLNFSSATIRFIIELTGVSYYA